MEEILIADLALPAHAAAIVFLLNEYAKDDMGGGTELPEFVKDNLVTELRKRQGVHVVLAFADGSPAGMAVCFEGFSTFACKPLLNIHDIIVASRYRGRGISKRLLAKAEEMALRLGCCKLTLEVLEGNTLAQAAYKASGFAGYELAPKMGKAMFWQKKLGETSQISPAE
ncbi:MAG: GNAT family N-acetyltransferase [Gallionellaceae bacterium]|nr:MAG: GNAT family N-acetyltransferase [Gallionellaceae bacterium]